VKTLITVITLFASLYGVASFAGEKGFEVGNGASRTSAN
jgi:hypothetical protein